MEEISKGLRVVKILKRVMNGMKQNMMHQFKEMQLTGPQGMLVGILAHYGEMKITDLSEKLGMSVSNVSGIIDRLENQGIVERIRSKEDRRVVLVSVNSEFRKNIKGNFNEIEKRFEIVMNKATPEELDTILKGLDTLEKLMNRQNE